MEPLTRRRFLAVCGALAAGAGTLGAYAHWIEPRWFRIHYLDMPVAGLPRALEGTRLVQMSDLHVSGQVGVPYLLECMAAVRALAPEIVVYTGDMTNATGTPREMFVEVLRGIARGRLATLAVPGNHDYGHNWSYPEQAAGQFSLMRDAGVDILRNEVAVAAGLQVLGLDDLWAGRCRPAEGIKKLDTKAPALVLCHNPDGADLPGWGDYHGWILCGHTHGGQCKPPFLPPPLLPVVNRRYTAGLIPIEGGRTCYINRGLGHIKQVRFNVRPEITCFTLRRATQL